jgi:hypothetical protein
VRTPNGHIPVGAIQSLSIDEDRQIQEIDEVGTDGHIDSTPIKSTNISGSCDRIRFDNLRMSEAFSRSFMHVSSQVYPFDIVVLDSTKFATGSQVSTVIKSIWMKKISYAYTAENWVIHDRMDWTAEGIFSTVNGGPAAQGGQLGLSPFGLNNENWIEVSADMGQNSRRGSLDAAGLIDIGSSLYVPNTLSIY